MTPSTDFINGDLYDEIVRAFAAQTAATPGIDTTLGTGGVCEAPLAVQGAPPTSGLFGFDKYSSAPLLAEAVRDDVGASAADDRRRRLFVVPNAHVTGLQVQGDAMTRVDVAADGRIQSLPVTASCAVVLASSTIESTRLALASFPTPLMGGNLMAHLRTDFGVRIRRNAFHPLPQDLSTAAALIRGGTADLRFHIQLTASANHDGSDDLLFRMIPDLDLLDVQLANDDPTWIAITLRGVAEMAPNPAPPTLSAATRWIDLSDERDEWGMRRAWVNLAVDQGELRLWRAMEDAMLGLIQRVAGSPNDVEYRYDGGWQRPPFGAVPVTGET